MKYGIIQYGMWAVFQHSFQEHLIILNITDNKIKKEIMKKAKWKYREIISEIEQFGENDVLLMNILSAALFAAIYLCLPPEYRFSPLENQLFYPETENCESLVSGKITMRDLSDFYENSMNDNLVMKWYLKRSCFSDDYLKKQKEQAEKSQKSQNPYSWRYTFHLAESGQHFDAIFTHCGIWYLMNKLGIPEITPAMCRYDYGMTKYSDVIFTRKGTLAGGAETCDCHYNQKMK